MNINIFDNLHKRQSICSRTHTLTYTSTHAHSNILTHIYTHTRASAHTYMHARACTYAHTHSGKVGGKILSILGKVVPNMTIEVWERTKATSSAFEAWWSKNACVWWRAQKFTAEMVRPYKKGQNGDWVHHFLTVSFVSSRWSYVCLYGCAVEIMSLIPAGDLVI